MPAHVASAVLSFSASPQIPGEPQRGSAEIRVAFVPEPSCRQCHIDLTWQLQSVILGYRSGAFNMIVAIVLGIVEVVGAFF